MPNPFLLGLALGNIVAAGANAMYYPNEVNVAVAVLCTVVGIADGALAWMLRK